MDVANATAQTLPVAAGNIVFRTVDLNAEDVVTGRISVVGGESGDINFSVVNPHNQSVVYMERATVTNFNFKADEKGTYTFIFDNSMSSIDKTVSFNYDVEHYWFGMPQEVVLMLIVVFIGVLGLMIYAMAKH
jgi:hypothetical protein